MLGFGFLRDFLGFARVFWAKAWLCMLLFEGFSIELGLDLGFLFSLFSSFVGVCFSGQYLESALPQVSWPRCSRGPPGLKCLGPKRRQS